MVALESVSVSRERETRPEEVSETSSRGEHAEGDAPRLRAGSSDANNSRRKKPAESSRRQWTDPVVRTAGRSTSLRMFSR